MTASRSTLVDPASTSSPATSADQAGGLQPALERGEVHARGRGGRRRARRRPTARSGRGDRHRPGHRRRGSRADLRGVPADGSGQSSSAREPGSDSRSRSGSSSCTAAGSGSRASSGREARSSSPCPRSRRRDGRRADPDRRGQREEHEAVPGRAPVRGISRHSRRRPARRAWARRANRPDLVLMDIQLPDIDGVEALGRLRADAAHSIDTGHRLHRAGDARGPGAISRGGLRRLFCPSRSNLKELIDTVQRLRRSRASERRGEDPGR